MSSALRMKPLGILHLYRVRLRARFVQEALAVLGIAVGVGLLFASQVADTSLSGSVRQLTSGVVGEARLALLARGPQGFDERLLSQVQHLEGVRSAAPVLQEQANVVGPSGSASVELIGADPRSVHLGGRLLQRFSAAALARAHGFALPVPIARELGLEPLQMAELQVGGIAESALLGITLQEAEIGPLVHSPVALAPLAYAQQVTGMVGRVTGILVQPSAGRDASVAAGLRRLATSTGVTGGGRLNVVPADYSATLFEAAARPTDESTALFAAISALVGFLFAFNAMLLTLPARRALIADLRLDGYGPMTVVQVLLFDALVLGIAASLLGLALGDELSRHLFHQTPGYLSFAFPVGSQRIVTWQSVLVAVAGGMLAACVGVLAPLLDAVLRRSHAGAEPKRSNRMRAQAPVLGGLVCLVLTAAIVAFAPQVAVIGIVSLTGALLLLLPSLLRVVLLLAERLSYDIRARAPFVALAELRSTWPRTVGIAATGAVAVFGSVAIQGAHADLQRGLDQSAKDVSGAAQVWAYAPGTNNLLATTPFAPTKLAALAALPGVKAVRLYRGGFLDYGTRRVWVSGPPRDQAQIVFPHQLVRGSLALADERVRAGGWAVVSQAIADEHHLHIGSSFTLPSQRPLALRVAALSTNIGWPPGAIIVNADEYARGWESPAVSAYEIDGSSGVPSGVLRSEVQQALGASTGLVAQTALQRERASRVASRQGLSRLTQIATLVLIAAVLAMAAAMANMIWQRRARLARLKLDGFSDFAVWRTLLLESVLLVGCGCSIGALFGLCGQLLGSHAILAVTGFPVIFSFGLLLALASLALVTAVAVAVTAIPGYLIARARPAVGF